MTDLSELREEVLRVRDYCHREIAPALQQGVAAYEAIEKLEDRIGKLESLPVSIAELKLIVDRLEKIVWGGAATVGLALLAQILQLVFRK